MYVSVISMYSGTTVNKLECRVCQEPMMRGHNRHVCMYASAVVAGMYTTDNEQNNHAG